MPVIRTAEDAAFGTELIDGVTKGYGVVDGETEHERIGVNYDGRYVLVQRGCGTNCMRAALVDGRTGAVLRLPQLPGERESGFELPTGTNDLRTLEFRWNSALLGVPRVADGLTYRYVLAGGRWRLLGKVKTPADHH